VNKISRNYSFLYFKISKTSELINLNYLNIKIMRNIMRKTITLLIILTANVTYSQVPNYVPTIGLVGWWPLNGNGNDVSGNGNNGTVNGAISTTDRLNVTNSAYSFNGNYIEVPNSPNINPINNLSISTWVFLNQYVNNQNFVSKDYSTFTQPLTSYTLKMGDNSSINSKAQIQLSINGTKIVLQSLNNIPLSQWCNIVGTYDGIKMRIYINGILDNFLSVSGNIGSYATNLNFGRWSLGASNGDPQFLNGKLDDIGIWNRALTQTEITALYTSALSSESFTNTSSFQLYPNPANDFMQFKSTEMVEKISIYNTLGQLVQENKTNSMEGAISIEHLAQGSYFVKVNNQNTSYTLLKK
jgi:hypothetical protein